MGSKEQQDITFLMIGCQRCGTTWTDAALRAHPSVYLPEQKQSYFFDRNYDKGMEWYLERFQGTEEHHTAVGEIATGYCLLEAAPLMAKHFPDVKLMMVMRNPIERAYSNFQTRRIESGWNSFEEALESDPDLIVRGEYIDQIECLMQFYDKSNVLFLLYDDLHIDDKKYLDTILEFLGVDATLENNLIGQRKNAAMCPNLRKWLHRFGLKPIVDLISKSRIGDSVRRSRKNKGKAYEPMNASTKEKLLAHYLPYNERLSTFLQKDLTTWNASHK